MFPQTLTVFAAALRKTCTSSLSLIDVCKGNHVCQTLVLWLHSGDRCSHFTGTWQYSWTHVLACTCCGWKHGKSIS